jgi:hypothetical protein
MLVFRPHEKNLFGQTRSWLADGAGGQYVIEKSPSGDTYQARWHGPGLKPELLQKGMWLPAYERAKQICEQDATVRVRARIAAQSRDRRAR